jgi:hypothetical protein
LNSVIIAPASEYALRETCKERRAGREDPAIRAVKSDAAIATIGIITFSHLAQSIVDQMTPDEQNRLFLETATAIAERMNTTLTGLVVHRDETAIHAHFQCPAVQMNGLPVSTGLTPKKLSFLQDIAGEIWEPHGIKRGKRKRDRIVDGDDESTIIHRGVRQLHDDLPAEIEAAESRLIEAETKLKEVDEKLQKMRRLIAKAETDLATKNGELSAIEKRLETYKRREAAIMYPMTAVSKPAPAPLPAPAPTTLPMPDQINQPPKGLPIVPRRVRPGS